MHSAHRIVGAVVVALCLQCAAAWGEADGDGSWTVARARSASNLSLLGIELSTQAWGNRGAYPANLEGVTDFIAQEALRSPFGPAIHGRDLEYLYFPGMRSQRGRLPAEVIVAYDQAELEWGQGTNVLMGDGRVRWMKMAAFREAIAASQKAMPGSAPVDEKALQARLTGEQKAERMKGLAEVKAPALPTKSFFTVDDARSWFADDIDKVSPFEKDGKAAVRVHLFECETCDITFVSHLERLSPAGQAEMTKLPAATRPADANAVFSVHMKHGQVKKPRNGEWVSNSDIVRASEIMSPTCPKGHTDVLPVYPE